MSRNQAWFLRAGAIGSVAPVLGATYYVSANNGSDSNNGLSQAAPFQTISKLLTRPFAPGDRIFFERGGVYYTGGLNIRGPGNIQLQGSAKVAVDAYGTGNLPEISAWKICKPTAWTQYATNVWRIDINADITGNTYTTGEPGADIGRLLVDGVIKTMKQQTLGGLANDWDYYSDFSQYLYVYSATNPSTRAAEIKASPDVLSLIGQDPLVQYRNVKVTGTGGNGANLAGNDVDIQWCWLDCLGGSRLGTSTSRYGNGVQSFASGTRLVARNNLITNCYDVALTCQGYPMTTATSGWNDVDFSDNWIARCAQGVEMWANVHNPIVTGQMGPAGSGFNNVRARRMRFWDLGREESILGRWDYLVFPAFIQTTDNQVPYNPIPISVIEMHNCSENLFFFSKPDTSDPNRRTQTDFVLEASNISMPAGSRIFRGYLQTTDTIEQWPDFVATTGIGGGSTVIVEATGQASTPISTIYASWQASK